MKPTCTHLAVHARNVDLSVDFYQRYAQLLEVHRRTDNGTTVVWMGEEGRESAFVIVVLGFPHADAVTPPPMAHIGYAVGSRHDVDAVVAMATDDGILVSGPTEGGPVVGYYCIVADPDGNQVEFSFGQALGPDA
ncbi:MAG: VOC family protein [Deltaproteobacteria bacterium]